MPCINCNTEFDCDFCPTCGEKRNVDRITLQSITQSVFSGFVDMDKGLLYNLKHLTLFPQKTILEYVQGKRRQILNPVSYAIITIGIYLFIDSLIPRGSKPELQKVDVFGAQEMGVKLGYFIRDKMKFFWLTFALYSATFTRLFFRKYNFFEHLAINSFILGHATLVAILIRLVYNRELILFNFVLFFYMMFMMYKVFRNPKDTFGTAALSFLVIFLSYLFFLGVPFVYVIFFT